MAYTLEDAKSHAIYVVRFAPHFRRTPQNRPAVAQKVDVKWRGAAFRYLETAGPQQENAVEPNPQPAGGSLKVLVAAGAIITLTNVELGKVPEDLARA